jgi:murein DD-endopeptidase MepM/ murein hydrolase activator NlpD
MEIRKCDAHGCGHYGASRGARKHNGVDLLTPSGAGIQSPIYGTVTKLGYTYGDDLSFRYVQISNGGYDIRLFYVDPGVSVGELVSAGQFIGTAQDLTRRYDKIANHVHLECKDTDGLFIDPTPLALSMVTK